MGNWVHRLSQVDVVARTAVCTNCGPVQIKPMGTKKKDGQRIWRCKVSAYKHKGRGRNSAYRIYLKDWCECCGFVPEHKCQLDGHHKDGDHSNNAPENIETLCANCHRLESL